jgi:aspartyl-tRNA(Asn)/glutamyl-tRNA(Gln) amidotransferase subunit A
VTAPGTDPGRDLHRLSVAEAGDRLRNGTLTSRELTEHALERIARLDPDLHCFVRVTAERARADAARGDCELASGLDRGPMHGIPYALKDVIDTAGIHTTSHSWLMANHVPATDSTVARRLHAGGGVLIGKAATHEFALGGPSFELPFPPARNPWNRAHVPGASSSGCGAAVAAGMIRVAIGSDTSGSVRGPACQCGVVGVKPTYGVVSRHGVFPLSYSLDHVGPLARTVSDAALALNVIAGHDPRDPASTPTRLGDLAGSLDAGVAGLRIGYARAAIAADARTAPEVLAAIDQAAGALRELGAVVEEVTLPPLELFNACGRVIMTAEAFAIHEHQLRDRPLEFGRYTYQRIVPGAGLTAADMVQAFRLRRELADAMSAEVFGRYAALITASALAPAARFDDFGPDWPPRVAAATATQTIIFNVTGHPAVCLPAGFSSDGLPLGVQVAAGAFHDALALRVAAALESRLALADRWPC